MYPSANVIRDMYYITFQVYKTSFDDMKLCILSIFFDRSSLILVENRDTKAALKNKITK